MTLLLGYLFIPFIPTFFHHLLVLVDQDKLEELNHQQENVFFVATSSCVSILQHSSLYDCGFDIDHQQIYTLNGMKVRL